MTHAVYEEKPCDQCTGSGKMTVVVRDVGTYDEDCFECDGSGVWVDLSTRIEVEYCGTDWESDRGMWLEVTR